MGTDLRPNRLFDHGPDQPVEPPFHRVYGDKELREMILESATFSAISGEYVRDQLEDSQVAILLSYVDRKRRAIKSGNEKLMAEADKSLASFVMDTFLPMLEHVVCGEIEEMRERGDDIIDDGWRE